MSAKAWLVTSLGIAAVVGGLGGYKYMQVSTAMAEAAMMPEPAETVQVVSPRMGTWAATATAIGTVTSLRRVDLRNEVAGTVAEVGFESGDIVRQGQLLLRLDPREEEAELAAARADADLARLTLERRQRLAKSQAGSVADLDAARSELDSARARVAALQARIAKKTLTAPFDARVGLRDLQVGAYLSEGTTVAMLEGIHADAYVDFAFPQETAAALKPGDRVTVSGRGMEPVPAVIQARDARIDPTSRTVRFRAVLAGMGGQVQPGAFLDVTAVTASPVPALFIPLTAVRRAPYGDHVFVVGDAGGTLRASQTFVRLGPVSGEEVVVLEGLDPGRTIAAMGSFKLREGVAVTVGSPASAQTAEAGGR